MVEPLLAERVLPNNEREALSHIKTLYNRGHLMDVALHCSKYCEIYRDYRQRVERIFVHSLSVYGQYQEKYKGYDELIDFYLKVLDLYPRNIQLYCNFGAHLLRMGMLTRAEKIFERVLKSNSNYLPAFKNLQDIYNLQVERWNFRSLNDQFKNEAYKTAIENKIKQKFDVVFEVGNGSGLFSIYAEKSAVASTYVCKQSNEMFEIARNVMSYNNADVKLLRISYDSFISGINFSERVSLMVTEMMDCGLLGKGLLSIVSQAWDRLLKPHPPSKEQVIETGDYGFVIPSKVSFWINAIECDAIARKYVYPIRQRIANYSSPTDRSLFLNNVALYTKMNKPYDAEQLQIFKFKLLSESQQLMEIDLNDQLQVKNNISDPQTCSKILVITCNSPGFAHAIVGYTKAILDKDIILSNEPTISQGTCREQAIFPLMEAIEVVKESVLVINARWINEKITLDLIEVIHPPGIILPPLVTIRNENTVPLNDTSTTDCRNNVKAFEVSMEVVSLFNDDNFINYLYQCAEYFINYINYKGALRMLDGSTFPLIGLIILHNLSSLKTAHSRVRLMTNFDVSAQHRDLLKHVIKSNGIGKGNVSQLDINEICCQGDIKRHDFDIIFTDVIKMEGDLHDLKMIDMKALGCSMKITQALYPLVISIRCQLVHSQWLDNVSTVNNPEMVDLGIARFMNKYRVDHHSNINLDKISYVPLSNVFEAVQLHLKMLTDQLGPLRIQVPITKSGKVTGICYWYNLYYMPNKHYSTLNDTSRYRQAAFLTTEEINVSVNETVFVYFEYVEGVIKLSISTNSDNPPVECNTQLPTVKTYPHRANDDADEQDDYSPNYGELIVEEGDEGIHFEEGEIAQVISGLPDFPSLSWNREFDDTEE